MKKFLAMLLVLAILAGAAPVYAAGEESAEQVLTGDVEVEGSNDFGAMLSRELSQERDAADYGYSVTGLTVEGPVATVGFNTLEAALLVVAVYSEDGLQLLASGQTRVESGEKETAVQLEGDMPEYFLVSAYLLDLYDGSPLGYAYDTPMYTREMQELLASTADDYPQDRVLNLDADRTTNFAVAAEGTRIIEAKAGVNTVLQADREQGLYRIGNADGQILSLQPGDVFLYPYGENALMIVKVAAITQNGDGSVSITAAEAEMEEVFSHLKLEDSVGIDDAVADTDALLPGVTLEKKGWETEEYRLRAVSADTSLKGKMNFVFDSVECPESGVSVTGSLGLEAGVSLEYYISENYIRLDWALTVGASVDVEAEVGVSGGPKELVLPIIPLELPLIGGLASVDMTPSLVAELSASVKLQFSKLEFTYGFYMDYGEQGFRFVPVADWYCEPMSCEVEGKLFIGLLMEPTVEIAESFVLAAKMTARAGVELSVKSTIAQSSQTGDTYHPCAGCFDGDIAVVFKVGTSVEVLNQPIKATNLTLMDWQRKIADFYFCNEHEQLAFGECPRLRYRVTVTAMDAREQPAGGVTVLLGEQTGITNENGVAEFWAEPGEWLIQGDFGGETRRKRILVEQPQKVILSLGEEDDASDIFELVDPAQAADLGKVIATGFCGEDGDNAVWNFYSSGILEITGSGRMADYNDVIYCETTGGFQGPNGSFGECNFPEPPEDAMPWFPYLENMTGVIVREGITYLGSHLFDYETVTETEYGHRYTGEATNQILTVSLPTTLREIGYKAFSNCRMLRSIQLPVGLEKIGHYAFEDCEALLRISIPYTVTKMESHAFLHCESLTGVNLPEGLTAIPQSAFSGCNALTDIVIPESVTEIGGSAFQNCAFSRIILPKGLKTLGPSAFSSCKNLTEIEIPEGVTKLDSTFYLCTSLARVVLPGSLRSIEGYSAFGQCKALERITLPEGLVTVGDSAFLACSALKEVILPESLEAIGEKAFDSCTALPMIVIPRGVKSIGDRAFWDCDKLELITFQGDAPVFEVGYTGKANTFLGVKASAYYPAGNETWTEAVRQQYGGRIYWKSYEGTPEITVSGGQVYEAQVAAAAVEQQVRQVNPGTVTDGAVKTAFFEGLVPGAEYVLLVVGDPEAEPLLGAGNLKFIDQKAAEADGTVSFRYILQDPEAVTYVVACGASNRDLKNAAVTFPELRAKEAVQAVNPEVVYEGKLLKEGLDYVILGAVSFAEAGSYTCYIRGIRNYTGLVECVYTVTDRLSGDIDGSGKLNNKDVILLMQYMAGWDVDVVEASLDIDGNGKLNNKDAILLMQYLAGWNVTIH